MYISELKYKNVGPIKDLKISCRKNKKNLPVPLIIVGKNGSGKSILLSNIVDAFYEIANKEYDNATESNMQGHQFYKEIAPIQISLGEKYMVSHIVFEQEDEKIDYIFKSGDVNFDEYKKIATTDLDNRLNWHDKSNFKNVIVKEKIISNIFEKNIVCYFGPNRYMKPIWMGYKYFTTDEVSTYSVRPKYTRVLNNPITATNIAEQTLQWLFDIITDSRADLEKNETGYTIVYPVSQNLDLLSISRKNAERIMSEILGQEIIFRMWNRSSGKRRFSIISKSDNKILIPSLDALSTGQLALFNLFATIIKYADVDDINLSQNLNDITGIVVVDEIELHLHTKLQREILPKLIALFPKVQFIISSHSPLFLLGMKEIFGEEFDVIEMPSGELISVEQFSEFDNAYNYIVETERFRDDIQKEINKKIDLPLIVTEGITDRMHLKAAYNHLLKDDRCSEWLADLKFNFLKAESNIEGSQIKRLCEESCKIPQLRKLIFIADRDVKEVVKFFDVENKKFNDHGNNVFSFCLPVPEHRKDTPQICIEHYYTDDELKTEVDIEGIKRRLFLGNEFEENGFYVSDSKNYFCKCKNVCGENSISIIDGSDLKKVIIPKEKPETNYALSKKKFAEKILKEESPFNKMDFSSFIPVFEIIRDILNK